MHHLALRATRSSPQCSGVSHAVIRTSVHHLRAPRVPSVIRTSDLYMTWHPSQMLTKARKNAKDANKENVQVRMKHGVYTWSSHGVYVWINMGFTWGLCLLRPMFDRVHITFKILPFI